jgi:hypothetical protein
LFRTEKLKSKSCAILTQASDLQIDIVGEPDEEGVPDGAQQDSSFPPKERDKTSWEFLRLVIEEANAHPESFESEEY